MGTFSFGNPAQVERVAEASNVNQGERDEVLLRLAARMKQNITTGDRRRHLFKKYTDCFTGMEAVDWMLEQMEAKSVAEAVRKGQGLLTNHYIEKVDKEVKFEYNKRRFYRFTPTTPEFVNTAVERPLGQAALDLPLSAASRRRAFAALIGGFVADAASTSLNGVSHPEKTIPNLLRLDFDPAFCGLYESPSHGAGSSDKASGRAKMESSTGFETRILLQCVARRGQIQGSQLAKDAYWGFKNDHRLLSSSARAFLKKIHTGKQWPHCAIKCRSIDVLAMIPIVVALYAGTNSLFTKVDELVSVFYTGQRVRDAALVAAFILEQVILGASVLQAMRMSIRTERLTVKQRKGIFKAFTKTQLPSYEAIQKFGNKGSLPGGFYAVLQPLFVLSDYPTAVRENIIGGGRTCRRAMFIGACFAAQDGLDSIPEIWIKKTQYYDFIEADAQALMGRRDIKASSFGEEDDGEQFMDRMSEQAAIPYVDYTTASSQRQSMAQSVAPTRVSAPMAPQRRTSSGTNGRPSAPPPPPPAGPPQHMGSYGRDHSKSFASNSSSPRSVASNYSYGSATTTGSSVRSVIDLGDMDKFYESRLSASSARSDRRMSFEMHKFFTNYGSYGSSNGSLPRSSDGQFTHSGVSTVRTSTAELNPLRVSDLNPFFQRGSSASGGSGGSGSARGSSSSFLRRNSAFTRASDSKAFPTRDRHHPLSSSFTTRTPQRSSEPNAYYQPRYTTPSHQRMDMDDEDIDSVPPSPLYRYSEVENPPSSDDVVLAHRMSLDDEQRVSLHAIL